jgi:hypothetical protein
MLIQPKYAVLGQNKVIPECFKIRPPIMKKCPFGLV